MHACMHACMHWVQHANIMAHTHARIHAYQQIATIVGIHALALGRHRPVALGDVLVLQARCGLGKALQFIRREFIVVLGPLAAG